MRFFDAHCDTIGAILEGGADFLAEPGAAAEPGPAGEPGGRGEPRTGAESGHPPVPHVTLSGLKAGNIGAQVFAAWVWGGKYKGREFETGMAKVEAVRRLCAEHPNDLALAATGADLAAFFACSPEASTGIAVLPSLEGADPLLGDVDNLAAFHKAGVRLITVAWGDNAFCGSSYGDGSGLTAKGEDLVGACEDMRVVVDVSHLSDRGFMDVCRVADRPFVASHSDCRSLCPSPRNLTDEMIRDLGERGGVMGATLACAFLSADYYEADRAARADWFGQISSGSGSFDDVLHEKAAEMASVVRPPLSLLVDHVKWAINVGGEDCVGLGGDLDGVDYLPAGFEGVADYPRIEELLREGGLTPRQVEKVCYENFLRVFRDVLG